MADDREAERNVPRNVSPLTSTERVRRHRERKRLEKAGKGPGRPFTPGHQLSVTHGATSPVRVSEVAAGILGELLDGRDCPEHLKDGGGQYRYVLELWASAMAQARLLRAWLDAQDVVGAMTELTQAEENEQASEGSARRSMTSRRVASVLDMIHRAETRAGHLAARLGLDPLSQKRLGDLRPRFDMALYMAALDQDEAGEEQAGA